MDHSHQLKSELYTDFSLDQAVESKEQPSYVKNFCQIKDTTTCVIQLNLMTSEFEKHMRWFDEFFLWTLAGLHDLSRSN